MHSLHKSPLFHFVLAGVILFGLFGRNRDADVEGGDRSREIVVTEGRVDNLATIFEKTWQRPPTVWELHGLIDEFVHEEIYYREAIAMGLDRDDVIIRRRLKQKIEFLLEDLAASEPPADEVLVEFLNQNAEKYQLLPSYDLRQVYLDPNKPDEMDLEARAKALITELESVGKEGWDEASLSALGDGLRLIPSIHRNLSTPSASSQFGTIFAQALDELPEGKWSGPVPSGYGAHLVRVDKKTPGRLPELAEVRTAVLNDWTAKQRKEAADQLYDSLLHRYTVTYEEPDGSRRGLERPDLLENEISSSDAAPASAATSQK